LIGRFVKHLFSVYRFNDVCQLRGTTKKYEDEWGQVWNKLIVAYPWFEICPKKLRKTPNSTRPSSWN